MTDFLKEVGTTEVARDSLNMDVNKPASWSAQDLRIRPVIPSGPAAFLIFTLLISLRTRPPTGWIHDRCSVCCFLTRCSAVSRRRHCIQSGRRRCLALRPAMASHLCGGVISRGTYGLQSLPHASRVIELEMWLNSLPVPAFSGSYCLTESVAWCFVLAHVSWQQTGVVCGSTMVNRITDWSVHPRFPIRKCPYCYCFSGLLG